MRPHTQAALLLLLSTSFIACGENTSPERPPTDTRQTQDAHVTESKRINVWFDERFEEQLQMNPATLTRLARKDRYDQYDDLSEAEQQRQLDWLANTIVEMEAEFDYDQLDLEAKTSWDLWKYRYQQRSEAFTRRHQRYVFSQMNGPQSSLAQFMIRFHQVDSAADMEAYIARIQGISQAATDLLDQAKANAAAGTRPPRFAYEGASREANNLITGAPFESGEDSPLWADAKAKITNLQTEGLIDADQAEGLLSEASTALRTHFYPSYSELITWLDSDLDNAPVEAAGVLANPDGETYYNFLLRLRTTTNLTADEIHELGLAEVERIQTEMRTIMAQVGFDGSLQAFFEFLREDERFQYPNTNAGRQGYIDDSIAFLDFINLRLADYFGILPQASLDVRRVEPFREQDGAPQHYSRGAPDGSRPGVYYAHLSDMQSMPKHLMEAIAYHEGNPGHHMQLSIAQESTLVPQFRTQTFFTAYTEGWGLYAELLAKEMGAYQDPYSDFGRLSTEIWRAARLVVDTGIHAKGWSEAGAVAYFQENTALADGAIRAEVRRYFVMPGQATAYKIGMMKILELRAYASTELGDQFDIREFHDVVLGGGALPLDILERRINNWVEASRAATET